VIIHGYTPRVIIQLLQKMTDEGRIKMGVGGRTRVMQQGDIMMMPQNTRRCFTGLENSLILECYKPDIMSDSIFDDERIAAVITRFA